jgi:RNA polymerase sigma factor (sigma-70 family)
MAVASHPVETFARKHNRTLRGWLNKKFGVKLTPEDISDVIAETYSDAWAHPKTASLGAAATRGWIYDAARKRALNKLREKHGRDGKRPSDLSYDDLVEDGGFDLVAQDRAALELLNDEHRAENEGRVRAALQKLPAAERDAITYHNYEALPLTHVGELLGVSKSEAHRIHKRGLERLKQLLSFSASDDCTKARSLLKSPVQLSFELLGWREAHLEGCFNCQVFTQRRVHVLLPALPVAGAPGPLAHLLDKLAYIFSPGKELPAEAVNAAANSSSGAAAGTASSGSATVGAASAAKVTVVASAAAIAATSAVVAAALATDDKPAREPAARSAAVAQAPPANPSPTAAPARTPQANKTTKTDKTKRRTKRRQRTRSKTQTTTVVAASTPAPTPAPAPPPAPTPAPAPAPAPVAPAGTPVPAPSDSSSDFTQEFSP